MPSFFSLVFFLALLTAPPKDSFKGSVELRVASPQFNGNLTLLLAPPAIRADFKQGSQSFSILSINGTAYRLNHQKKTYTDIDLDNSRRTAAALDKLETYTFKRLTDETLLNLPCRHFTLATPKQTVEVWTASGVMDSTALATLADAGGLIGLTPKMISLMNDNGVNGFPLKIIASQDSTAQIRVETTRLSKKTPAANLLRLPKNYNDESE
jgi:hypothetical protein